MKPEGDSIEVKERQVGEVKIIECSGSLTGIWAQKLASMLEIIFSSGDVKLLGVNLLKICTIDTLGIRTIVSLLPKARRVGIICPNVAVASMLKDSQWGPEFEFFFTEIDLINSFSQPGRRLERRKYRRYTLKVPAFFSIRGDSLPRPIRERVTTANISGGGMLVDGFQGIAGNRHFTGNEGQSFDLHLGEDNKKFRLEAKPVRMTSSESGYRLAVQFVNLSEELRHRIMERIAK